MVGAEVPLDEVGAEVPLEEVKEAGRRRFMARLRHCQHGALTLLFGRRVTFVLAHVGELITRRDVIVRSGRQV